MPARSALYAHRECVLCPQGVRYMPTRSVVYAHKECVLCPQRVCYMPTGNVLYAHREGSICPHVDVIHRASAVPATVTPNP